MMSLTPDHFRKAAGLGVVPSPLPFLTPRPERRSRDSRGSDRSSIARPGDRDREINVQVLLRCRPLSDEEQRINVPKVISCNEQKREVCVLQSVAHKQVDRVFTFDKVFGPKAQQRSIYDQAIAPIVSEVLEGFNCTVFAYGQTGTGKTYTMEGELRNKGGDLPAEAGVIPRAVRQIFDTLEAQNADYSMKVTFLELYNEEVTDLLAQEEVLRPTEERQRKPICLMEDGKGCVVVRGLEEETVYSANEIYALLERGAAKRRTADTLLNKRSSRSHSIFTITVHVKEAAVGDEDLIKCGKLNLVDLAGSENICRSGAREGRVREAGEINKSLLTLGRVINALVEHSAHVPYRDSKLTRVLRDSLGGKTKTCIIATVSPSAHSLEETLSTLDYAYRAKNIKNKPEANQKLSKAILLKDLYLEIERMKEDVRAAREKNGVYIPHERYVLDEAEKKARNEKIEILENDLTLSAKEVDRFQELYLSEQEQKLDIESELKDCKMNVEKTKKELLHLEENYRNAVLLLKEAENFISNLQSSENTMIERAKDLRTDLQAASDDLTSLFAKLDKKEKMEAENHSIVLTFGSQLDQCLKNMHKAIIGSVSQQKQHLRSMEEHSQSLLAEKCEATRVLESKIKSIAETYMSGVTTVKNLVNIMRKKANSDLEQMNDAFSFQVMEAEKLINNMEVEAKEVIDEIQNSLTEQKMLLSMWAKQQEQGLLCSLNSAQVISDASVHVLSDLHYKASQVMMNLEESQAKRTHQLAVFEKTFQEQAAKEKEQALEVITAALDALMFSRTAMVSEASKNLKDVITQDNNQLQLDMSTMQHVSSEAKEEVNKYVEETQTRFIEDMFSVAESRVVMESIINECSTKVDYSRQHWETSSLNLINLNERHVTKTESVIKDKVGANHTAYEEFLSASSTVDADVNSRTSGAIAAVHDALAKDKEGKAEMDSMISMCMNQLQSTQESHGENVSTIRVMAEKHLTKDYLCIQVDEGTCATPKRRAIAVPSIESIEEMRTPTPACKSHYKGQSQSENRSSGSHLEGSKILHQLLQGASPFRAPFSDVN